MKLSPLFSAAMLTLLFTSPSVFAAKQACTGKDETNAPLVVSIDTDANKLTANNQEFALIKPSSTEKPEVILVTAPFDTEEYGSIYITLANKKDAPDHMIISQVGVKDHETKATVDLTCKAG